MSTFVQMYHPLIPATATNPAWVALKAVDEHEAKGWVLVDPDIEIPDPVLPYYTRGQADTKFARTAPVLSDFVYDAPTGNLLSYKEDGIPIVLTYNADGTVATSKRGTEPTQTFTYSGGNLAGVA